MAARGVAGVGSLALDGVGLVRRSRVRVVRVRVRVRVVRVRATGWFGWASRASAGRRPSGDLGSRAEAGPAPGAGLRRPTRERPGFPAGGGVELPSALPRGRDARARWAPPAPRPSAATGASGGDFELPRGEFRAPRPGAGPGPAIAPGARPASAGPERSCGRACPTSRPRRPLLPVISRENGPASKGKGGRDPALPGRVEPPLGAPRMRWEPTRGAQEVERGMRRTRASGRP